MYRHLSVVDTESAFFFLREKAENYALTEISVEPSVKTCVLALYCDKVPKKVEMKSA